MKQKLINELLIRKDSLMNISKHLYGIHEEGFKEFKTCEFLVKFLKDQDFKIKENLMSIDTSFLASYGEGHPKIGFILNYGDLDNKMGFNLDTSATLISLIALKDAIDKNKGSIIAIGCPGEDKGGCKYSLVNQGVFEDIDSVFELKFTNKTGNIISSKASENLLLELNSDKNSNFKSLPFILNSLDFIQGRLDTSCQISCDNLSASLDNINLYLQITSDKFSQIESMRQGINSMSTFMNSFDFKLNIKSYMEPQKEIIESSTLSRLFFHNLKEAGLINIEDIIEETHYSSGVISHNIPFLMPSISITKNNNEIIYPSEEFSCKTINNSSLEIALKATQSLTLTAYDLICDLALLYEANNDSK
ncbi:MAG: hypothetical protein ACERKV_01905 [Clostridiaceae bacterium]